MIITNISFKRSLDNKNISFNLNGQIVQDADRLDAIGAIRIGRTFYYNGISHNKIYTPNIKPRINMSASEYRNQPNTVMNYFYEELLHLQDK